MSFKEYLPSKEFQKKVLIALGVIAAIVALFFLIKLTKVLIEKRWLNKQIKNLPVELRDQVDVLTIGELQRKDSNGNAIPDWEERLYGLDPFADGESNKKAIEIKKEELRKETGASSGPSAEMSNNTGAFSREFLSIVLSLQQSGALNKNAIDDISKSVGQELIPTELETVVTKSDLIVVRDTSALETAYYDRMIVLTSESTSAAMLGTELDILSRGLEGNDPTLFVGLDEIAASYTRMADAFKKVPVPDKLSGDHLAMTNSLYNIGKSLSMIKQLGSDPVIALRGFYVYGYASQVLDESLNTLAE